MGIGGGSVLVPWRPAFWIAAEVVPPLGAASCGLGCVYTPTAPCTPLPPMWGVGRARHRVSPPHAHSWPSSPPSHWHPRHARARGLAAAARLGRPDPGSPRSIPPRCLQHMPWHARGAPAAVSSACHGTRAAQPCAKTTNRAGGWENINGFARSDRKRLELPVVLAGWISSLLRNR